MKLSWLCPFLSHHTGQHAFLPGSPWCLLTSLPFPLLSPPDPFWALARIIFSKHKPNHVHPSLKPFEYFWSIWRESRALVRPPATAGLALPPLQNPMLNHPLWTVTPLQLELQPQTPSLYTSEPQPLPARGLHTGLFIPLTSCCHSLDLSDSNHPSGQLSLPWEKCPHPVDYFVCPPPHSLFLWNTDDWRKHLWLLWLFQLFSFPDDGLSAELYCDPSNLFSLFLDYVPWASEID